MSHNRKGHRTHGLNLDKAHRPEAVEKPPMVRQGINRQPERHPARTMPLSDRQKLVLAGVGHVEAGQTEIAERVGLQPTQVSSALYALQARGLVVRPVQHGGWKLA